MKMPFESRELGQIAFDQVDQQFKNTESPS